jgi:hypothetical protein
MLVFTNLAPSSSFSLVLQGKVLFPQLPLYLVLTRQADLTRYEFLLTDTSPSSLYATFEINSGDLPKGDYDVQIYNGDYIAGETDCLIDVPVVLDQPEIYLCDPLTIETSVDLNSIIQVGASGIEAKVIYTAKAKVEGTEETYWVNQSQPTYVVYEG